MLHVLPVNDPPRILSGLLPDTLALPDRACVISIEGAAQDADDTPDSLAWQAETPGRVRVFFEDEGATARIYAPLTWSGQETILLRVVDPSGASDEVSVLVVRAAPLAMVAGDFDGDGQVGFSDFLAFVGAFGRPDAAPGFDLDGNGQVGFPDFLILAEHYGQASP